MSNVTKTCCGCKVSVGENHTGCDWEECPFCRGQLIACECDFHMMLGLSLSEFRIADTEGFTDEQAERLDVILEKKGRVPFGKEINRSQF